MGESELFSEGLQVRREVVYCGTPAGRQAFLAAHEALEKAGAFKTPAVDPQT